MYCEVCISLNPKDNRLRSSVMIEVDNLNLVIDTGPDFRQQMLREKVRKWIPFYLLTITKTMLQEWMILELLITSRKQICQYIVISTTSDALKLEFPYIFSGFNYPGVPKVAINIIKINPLTYRKL